MESVLSETNKAKILDDTLDETDNPQKDINVFVLVNSCSGSGMGKLMINEFNRRYLVSLPSNNMAIFYFYDLYKDMDVEDCFREVKEQTQQNKDVRILIGGGDGTIQWGLSEAIRYKVDFKKVIFGVLPIGTGNDFAGSIKWDNYKFKVNHKNLQKLAIEVNRSILSSYDVWDCQVECATSGSITEIKNGVQKPLHHTKILKSFTNYFGIGCDAQVTYFHQKINARYIMLKKIAYVIAGLKSFFCFPRKLSKVIKQFVQLGSSNLNTSTFTQQNQLQNKIGEEIVTEKELKQTMHIDVNDSCVTFLNSTRSMEINHIWATPHSIDEKKIFKYQRVNDGMIEIVSYRNQWSLVAERAFHMAKKVGQGQGPFLITFKQPDHKSKKHQPLYIHINGQPYKLEEPKSILISRNKDIPDSKIRVMVRK